MAAHNPAVTSGFTDLVGACADDADRDDRRGAERVTDAWFRQLLISRSCTMRIA